MHLADAKPSVSPVRSETSGDRLSAVNGSDVPALSHARLRLFGAGRVADPPPVQTTEATYGSRVAELNHFFGLGPDRSPRSMPEPFDR